MKRNTLTLLAVLTLACTATPTSVTDTSAVSFAETPTEGASDDMTVAASMATPLDSVTIIRAEWRTYQNKWIQFRAVWRYWPDSRGTTETQVFRNNGEMRGVTVGRRKGRVGILMAQCVQDEPGRANWPPYRHHIQARSFEVRVTHPGSSTPLSVSTTTTDRTGEDRCDTPRPTGTGDYVDPAGHIWMSHIVPETGDNHHAGLNVNNHKFGSRSYKARWVLGDHQGPSSRAQIRAVSCRENAYGNQEILQTRSKNQPLKGDVSLIFFSDTNCQNELTQHDVQYRTWDYGPAS